MKHTQVNISNLLKKFTFFDRKQENVLKSLGGNLVYKQNWFCKKNSY